MPQDSLRSFVYRSLISCNDSNGVVENETIRKSKVSSPQRSHRRGTQTYSNPAFVRQEERKETSSSKRRGEEFPTSSSVQLQEVSRGAQRINKMIDTWSMDITTTGHSKDISRDLLKGALDLQESLSMLCKLQEASKYMSKLQKKQRLKAESEVDEVGVTRVGSNRFDERTYETQKSRVSTSGSSRNCTEELKKVITESLSRQSLLTDPSVEKQEPLKQRKWDLVSDIPSTSSSQSAEIHSNEFVSFDDTVSFMAQQKKAKTPSVIAKLMGLEDFPAESTEILQKHVNIDKNLNQRKPAFDIEKMPKPRNHNFVDSEENSGRKTLKEIIETMHLKGLLKSSRSLQIGSSEASSSSDCMPPIVIMKPWHVQHDEMEETMPEQSSISEEEHLYHEEWLHEATKDHQKRSLVKEERKFEPDVTVRKQEEEKTFEPDAIVRKRDEEKTFKLDAIARKLDKKQEPAKKVLKVDNPDAKNMSKKLQTKDDPRPQRLITKNRPSTSSEILRTRETKETKAMQKAGSDKMMASLAQDHKQHKSEKANKKVTKVEVLPIRRKPVEKAAAPVSNSEEQVKATITKSRKVDKVNNNIQDHMNLQARSMQKSITKSSTKQISENAVDKTKKFRTREAKPMKESTPFTLKNATSQCKERNKKIQPVDTIYSTTSTLLGGHVQTEEQTEAPKVQIEAHKVEDQHILHEVRIKIDKQESSTESSQDVKHLNNTESSQEVKQFVRNKTTLPSTECNSRMLLLSSPAFVKCAEDLFDLVENHLLVLQQVDIKDLNISNLFLDCASELMEYRSRWNSQVVHPLLKIHVRTPPRIVISLNELVDEICCGLDKLRSYSKVDSDDDLLHVDRLFKMLETDVNSEGKMGSGGWDFGWKYGFTEDEVDQVVGEMEKQILSELVEDLTIDLMC